MLNHLLSLNIDKSWRRRTVQKLTPAQNLLDVAIGTADLSLEIMRQQKATKIQGIDVSREMMRIGKEKVSKAGFAENIRFDCGSALEMPYADNTFDALTCAYGLRNFPDADKGLAEFYRVMQPGAQLVYWNSLIRKIVSYDSDMTCSLHMYCLLSDAFSATTSPHTLT